MFRHWISQNFACELSDCRATTYTHTFARYSISSKTGLTSTTIISVCVSTNCLCVTAMWTVQTFIYICTHKTNITWLWSVHCSQKISMLAENASNWGRKSILTNRGILKNRPFGWRKMNFSKRKSVKKFENLATVNHQNMHTPLHIIPFPVKPVWQVQLYLPSVSVQVACVWQRCESSRHSSISVQMKPACLSQLAYTFCKRGRSRVSWLKCAWVEEEKGADWLTDMFQKDCQVVLDYNVKAFLGRQNR